MVRNRNMVEKLNNIPEQRIGATRKYFILPGFFTARNDKPRQKVVNPSRAIKIPEKVFIITSNMEFSSTPKANISRNFACNIVNEFKVTLLRYKTQNPPKNKIETNKKLRSSLNSFVISGLLAILIFSFFCFVFIPFFPFC
ncbi:MAG: hypothetical protein DRP06_01920 [Candidatus Aenigmatarchaeota archaeon]|nr:MAG: hypothetical protein DRP06_01920 [Candidatus Aenigmarchaeota archaeon]